MDENIVWLNIRDSLIDLYGDEYSYEDIAVSFTIMEEKFFEILNSLND